MMILEKSEILEGLEFGPVIAEMRRALIAQARGEGVTPMPMHLNIAEADAEIHFKAGYCRGGRYFALKVASGFPRNAARNLPANNGLILLCSAETGEPVAILKDESTLTDIRTAAVSAMAARELGRSDTALGILGTGVQARWQARMHAEVLRLSDLWFWGRSPAAVEQCAAELATLLPRTRVHAGKTPREVAEHTQLIVTATSAREPLLRREDVLPGTLISAVGSDSPGKQELDPEILESASLLLVDSLAQCERLGELQHARHLAQRAVELGQFCDAPVKFDAGGIVVADFTGLGIEDLFAGAYCYERLAARTASRGCPGG
jgi:ornithine cyclodeaminase